MNEGQRINTTEGQKDIEQISREVINTLKDRLAGKSFTISNMGGESRESTVTVIADRSNSKQAMWDKTSPNFVYVKREDMEHSGSISLNNLLSSPEATELVNSVMNEMKVPAATQEKVRQQIKKDYPRLN